tara:strand:+ start:2573 stop:2788 length:216 start_codon:yes stop_codon:yes gene_type:complete
MEECLELATVLAHKQNKPNKDFTKHIEEEIADVYFRLEKVSHYYNWVSITERIKIKKLKEQKKLDSSLESS